MIEGFYVWNIAHGRPTHCHATLESAVRESERLARANPGQTFHVLAVMGAAHQPEAPSLYTSTKFGLHAEIPF